MLELPSGPLDIQWEAPWVTRSSHFLVPGTQELLLSSGGYLGVPRSNLGAMREMEKGGPGSVSPPWFLIAGQVLPDLTCPRSG